MRAGSGQVCSRFKHCHAKTVQFRPNSRMFAKDTLQIYNYLFRFTTFLKCVPFRWNNELSVVKLYPLARIGRWLCYLNAFFTFSFSIFTWFSLLLLVLHLIANSSGIEKLIPSLLYLLGIIFACSLQFMSYVYQWELAILVNKIFQTSKLISKSNGPVRGIKLLRN